MPICRLHLKPNLRISMDVTTLTDATAFDDLRDEWLRLLAQMPFQSVFLTPQWQDVWWRHFAGDRQLCLFAVRSDDGVLRGLAPLMLDREAEGLSRLSFVGDLDVCDYCDVLVDPAYVSQVGAALVPAMLDAVGDEGDLELINLSAHSLAPVLLHQGLEAHGLTADRGCRDVPDDRFTNGVGGVSRDSAQ
jgi:CelD/BcsL family acetyltransferase involved in cellulose biosynthesis